MEGRGKFNRFFAVCVALLVIAAMCVLLVACDPDGGNGDGTVDQGGGGNSDGTGGDGGNGDGGNVDGVACRNSPPRSAGYVRGMERRIYAPLRV